MSSESAALRRWLRRLESFSPHEIELGLDRVATVLDRLPVRLPNSIFTVGGTNGKGSTVACLHAILRTRGLNVGSYTSPHLSVYNERIRLNDRFADDKQLIESFEIVDACREDVPLTYFEFGTLAALVAFAHAGMDYLVLEVGLGGRLDAVNAVEPSASLITNIALDHCDWLGDTIDAIAAEKAGILRPDKPIVFAGETRPVPIDSAAAESGAILVAAGRDYSFSKRGDTTWDFDGPSTALNLLPLPALAGAHQLANAAGAMALLDSVGLLATFTIEQIGAALRSLDVPGRMQFVRRAPDWIVDVAHNPAAALALTQALPAIPGNTIAVVGVLNDKDVSGVLDALSPVVDVWVAVTPESPRAMDAAELARRIAEASDKPVHVSTSIKLALRRAEEMAEDRDRVLVTGSFFTVGPAMDCLND